MSNPRFVEVYDYQGKYFERTSATGHVAVRHGDCYYSYGGGVILKYFEDNRPPGLHSHITSEKVPTEQSIEQDKVYYGKYSKIILPIPFSINKNPYAIKSEITRSEEWKTTQYSMISHNCVDLVKFYLEKLGYPAKKHGFTQTIRPHRYVDEVRELGKNLVGQIIQHIRNSIDKNDDNDFSLENENINQIEIPPLLKNELEKPPFNISLSSNSIDKEVYCQILEILAKKHYDREEPQDRYAELFQETLNICPQLMNFTYKDNSKFSFKDYAKDLGLSLSALAITFIVTPITFVISPFIVFGEFLVELTKKTPENLTDDLKKLAKYTLIGLGITAFIALSIFTGGATLAAAGGAGLIAALTSGASLVSFGFGLNMIFIASAIGMWLGFDLYSTDKLHSPRKAMRSLEEERNAPPVKTSTPVVDNPQPEIKHSNNHVTTLIQKADPSYSPAPVRVPSPEPVAPSTPSAPSSPSVPQVSVTFEDTEPKKGPKIS